MFFAIHVLQVLRAGWGNFASMVHGYELMERRRTPETNHTTSEDKELLDA